MNINVKLLPNDYIDISEKESISRIQTAKSKLGKDLLILGHHYQKDEIIQFADSVGDSYTLAKFAQQNKDAKYIVFCGVHFMAESADILTTDEQKVILPDITAGCSMADMADLESVEIAWNEIRSATNETIIPITYINSTAELKAFCGKNNGIVCTSSNAKGAITWALKEGNKIFFFPDQHLGRNTAFFNLGISLDEMILWQRGEEKGGNSNDDIRKAKVILWDGFCSVHQGFLPEHIIHWRNLYPDIKIIVHPECMFDVVKNSDYIGSTAYIVKTVEESPEDSKWAIGTEINLVNRLKKQNPDKFITPLSPYLCLCSTMYRIRLPYLLFVLDSLLDGEVINQIKVPEEIANLAKIALSRMLQIN